MQFRLCICQQLRCSLGLPIKKTLVMDTGKRAVFKLHRLEVGEAKRSLPCSDSLTKSLHLGCHKRRSRSLFDSRLVPAFKERSLWRSKCNFVRIKSPRSTLVFTKQLKYLKSFCWILYHLGWIKAEWWDKMPLLKLLFGALPTASLSSWKLSQGRTDAVAMSACEVSKPCKRHHRHLHCAVHEWKLQG